MDARDTVLVVIVDDDVSFRERTARKINASADMVCAESFGDTSELLQSDLAGFDVLLLDIDLGPGRSGVDSIADIRKRWPSGAIVMLSQLAPDKVLFTALREGASGYIFKGELDNEDFLSSVRDSSRGLAVMSPTIARLVRDHFATTHAALAELTRREHQVLNHVVTGKHNSEIADILFVAENTVKYHLRNIFAKLQVGSRAEAAFEFARSELGDVNVTTPTLTFSIPAQPSHKGDRIPVALKVDFGGQIDLDYSILVFLPDGLSLDMSPSPQVGIFSPETMTWTGSTKKARGPVVMDAYLVAKRVGTFLVQACVSECSKPIRTATAVQSIVVL